MLIFGGLGVGIEGFGFGGVDGACEVSQSGFGDFGYFDRMRRKLTEGAENVRKVAKNGSTNDTPGILQIWQTLNEVPKLGD